jgi:uncharacterized membrane protein
MARNSERSKRTRSQSVGIMMAAAVIPRSFQRSLMPRSNLDQGIVTGIIVAVVYMLGLLVQDSINTVASTIIPEEKSGWRKKSDYSSQTLRSTAISLSAIGVGYFLQKKYPYHNGERLPKSTARTSGTWVKYTGIAGSIIGAIELAHYTLSQDKKKATERDLLPLIIGAGVLYSLVGEYMRVKKGDDSSIKESLVSARPARVIGIGAAVTSVFVAITYTERTLAKIVDGFFGKKYKRLQNSWLPIGHVIAAGAMVYGLKELIKQTYAKIEHAADDIEIGFEKPPTDQYTSGSKQSLIDWNNLTVQGRRHLSRRLSANQINKVMVESTIEPIRIFVGLESANLEEERVELALAELERTQAYERETIVVISPTGTGYVNYIFSEAAEYLARGNIASIALQYSRRPSPMSLDRVDEGHMQYRMLLNGIHSRIESMPLTKRPRIVLFGESLGAWTSQDAFMHTGTDGLRALNIERALWIGTPKGSKWKEQLSSKKWLNVNKELIGVFDNFNEVLDLKPSQSSKIRYCLVTHLNDPISQFSLDLLLKQPEWVEDASKRPIGLESNVHYRTPTLFVQMLVDMKNALKPKPGEFVASGHDYRADLANFTAFAYGFTASEGQMDAIEQALRKNEVKFAQLVAKGKVKT